MRNPQPTTARLRYHTFDLTVEVLGFNTMKPITFKIDVTKILKEHLYKGEKGTYLDCAVFACRNGVDKYGNTHVVVQSLSKEAREKGEKGPMIGSLRVPGNAEDRTLTPRVTTTTKLAEGEEDDVPF